MHDIDGLQEAERIAALFRTPRTVKLSKLRKYVDGTQYEGREDFFSPKTDCPLLERAPCIVYPAVESAIRQHIDLAIGEGRFPKLTTGIGEDDTDLDDLFGLSEDDSKTFDAFLCQLAEHARYQDVCADALESAEATSSAAVVYSVRDGYLSGELVDPINATATFSTNGRDVERLEIRYPFIDLYQGEENKIRARCLLYRRVIDSTSDTVYVPAVAPSDGREPRWQVDKDRTADHGLGFCPVVWYAFKRRVRKANDNDGHAIHETLLDELDALNFSLSQRHRAALYCGDPQMIETGVSRDEQVAPAGSAPRATIKELRDSDGRLIYGFGYSERPRSARRKGAGTVWRYENEQAKVAMLTLPGDALQAVTDHCEDVLAKIEAVLGYTATSPEQVKGALSGKALGFLFARTTAFVDRVRRDFWDGFMLPSLSMMLRIVHAIAKVSPDSLYVAGIRKAMPILERFQREVEGAGSQWFCPRIRPVWGRYFDNGPEDEKLTIESCAMAFEKGIMTRELAIEKLRGIFAFDSASQIAEELDKKDEEEKALEAEQAQADRDAMAKQPGAAEGKPAAKPGDKPGLKKPTAKPPE